MFEELIFSEKNKLQLLLGESELYKISDVIQNDELPTYFRNYLKAYLSEQLIKLKIDILENYNINVNDLELNDNWRVFENACYEFTKLDANKIDEIIVNSVQLYFNFLIRPKQTIVNFLFRDELYQSLENLHIRLQYFEKETELISELEMWLENQISNIDIFKFRNAVNQINTNIFQNNNETKVSDWFIYLINAINSLKFNSEYSIYTILSIFSADLNWKGLVQFLNLNKNELIHKPFTVNHINETLIYYLAVWFKESQTYEYNDVPTKTQESENIEELEDYDKMMALESFVGEEESYETQEVELPEIEEIISDDEIIDSEMDDYDKMLASEIAIGEEESYVTNTNEEVEKININDKIDWGEVANNIINEDENKETPIQSLSELDNILAELRTEDSSIENEAQELNNDISEDVSEDDEFEKMAALIAGGSDVSSSPSSVRTISDKEPLDNIEINSEIDGLIQDISNKLDLRIGAKEDLKDYTALAEQIRLSDIKFVDLDDPTVSQTKRELYGLLREIKGRKAL